MYKVTCRRNTPLSSALSPSISSLWTFPRGDEESVPSKTERSEGRGEERGKERKKGEKRKRKKGKKKKRREKKAPVERNLVSRRSGGRDGGDGRRSGGEQQRGEESAYRGRGSRRIN